MSKKIQYRAVDVEQLSLEALLATFPEGSRVVVGVDVAKRKFLAAFTEIRLWFGLRYKTIAVMPSRSCLTKAKVDPCPNADDSRIPAGCCSRG